MNLRRNTIIAAGLLLVASVISAQTRLNINWLSFLKPTTFANLPSSPFTNQVWAVSDCSTAACTAGGGTISDVLIWSGSAWVVYGTSASGSASISFPQVISGTVNSGGIVYNSDTTHMASSAAGTAGAPVTWGGAGTQPGTTTIVLTYGGLGITSGTSGGVPCFTASTTALTSSAALASGNIVTGGGAGVCPLTVGLTASTAGIAEATASNNIKFGIGGTLTTTTGNASFGASPVGGGSNNTQTAGDALISGADNSNTGATETAGNIRIGPPGHCSGAGTTCNQGGLYVKIVRRSSGTPTTGDLACYTSTNVAGNCSGTSAVATLGVITAVNATTVPTIDIQIIGPATVNSSASATWTAGNYVCEDLTNGAQFGINSSTPCAVGTKIGIADGDSGSGTTHSVSITLSN